MVLIVWTWGGAHVTGRFLCQICALLGLYQIEIKKNTFARLADACLEVTRWEHVSKGFYSDE